MVEDQTVTATQRYTLSALTRRLLTNMTQTAQLLNLPSPDKTWLCARLHQQSVVQLVLIISIRSVKYIAIYVILSLKSVTQQFYNQGSTS